MAKRGRVVSTSISLSTKIADLGDSDCCLLATWLIPHADDQGRMEADPRRLKGQIAPLLPWITVEIVERALQKMAQVRYIVLYHANGVDLLQHVDWWREPGKPEYTAASDYPPPPGWRDCPAGKGTAARGGYGFAEFRENSGKVGDNPDKKLSPTPNPSRSPDPDPVPGEGEREGEGVEQPPDPELTPQEETIQSYEENIEPLTPALREELMGLMETYSPAWVSDAILIALRQRVRKFSYIEGVCNNCASMGMDVEYSIQDQVGRRIPKNAKPINLDQYRRDYGDLFFSREEDR